MTRPDCGQATQARVERADPQSAGVIRMDRANAKRRRAAAQSVVIDEVAGRRIVLAQAVVGADPDAAAFARVEREHGIRRQRARIAIAMAEVADDAGLRIEHIEAITLRARPHIAVRVDDQRTQRVARKRAGITRNVPELMEAIGAAIPTREPSAHCREPQIAVRIFRDGPDVVARERVIVAALTTIFANGVAVVPVEAALRCEPEESLRVLQDAHHRALRQSVAHGEMLEVHRPHVGDRCGGVTHQRPRRANRKNFDQEATGAPSHRRGLTADSPDLRRARPHYSDV